MDWSEARRFELRLSLGLIVLCFFLAGYWAALRESSGSWGIPGSLYLGLEFVLLSLATLGCALDARLRGRWPTHSAFLAVAFLWPVAIPIYLLWSRGLAGLWIVIVLIGGFSVCLWLGVMTATLSLGG